MIRQKRPQNYFDDNEKNINEKLPLYDDMSIIRPYDLNRHQALPA
jgi:hypothetical protein